ncbi:hypothetical protein [Actinomadura decatromicini]|uniref:hypothetical protein n=1 Tax=Actinomadura decatromicini TaxID=2604572 RepID=UPI001652C184|nr:hypothetical protein [Actinomadura decatromicini]
MNEQPAPPEAKEPKAKDPKAKAPKPEEPKPKAKVEEPKAGEPKAEEPKEKEESRAHVLNERGQRGTIQDRIGTERDALSGYAPGGTAIGRDQHNHYYGGPDGRRARIAPLRRRDVEEIERAFVAPEDFDELLQLTRDRRIVILQADRGSGRYAAARRLLCLLLAGDERRLFGVDPSVRLDELTADDLTEGAGYVYRDPARPDALTGFALDKISGLLEDAKARLVITVDAARPLTDDRAVELVLRLGRVQDRREIARGLLALELGDARAGVVLAEPDVAALLDAQLGQDGPPRHARAVAVELLNAHRQALPLARTAEQALRLRDDEQRTQWFESLETLSLQCMAVATAVLSGEPYETVALAAMQLKNELETGDPHADSLRRLDAPLTPTRRKWLSRLGAETAPSKVRLRFGATAPSEAIRYLDPYAQGKVLGYFWREFDEQRPRLLGWLRWCAEHPLESVRTRTAVATGFLAARAFDLVRALVIEPMAFSEDHRHRTVAAAALHATVTQRPALREPVRELLRSWGEPAETPWLRGTAARAWQVEYADGGAAAALDWLEDYTGDDSFLVTAAVCESVTELWETEWDRERTPARLLEWTSGRDEDRRLTGRLAFLMAAAQLVRRMPGDDFDWPGLLHIAAMDDARMRDVAALWRVVLNDSIVQEPAQDVLREWACTADDVPLVRRSFVRLTRAVATDGVTTGRLRFAARGWAEAAPKSSADVLTALNGR